jgi:hypothetical protein
VPVELPNLDDRTYADLVDEARALIPTHAPEWTNHNPSDPGITLIELFAYLSEMMIYRLNRVTDRNMLAFLKLLNGDPQWQPPAGQSLPDAVRETVLAMRQPYRAVTCSDFERLALNFDALDVEVGAPPQVARTRCVPRRDLVAEDPANRGTDEPAHVSVIVVPFRMGDEKLPRPTDDLRRAVQKYLEPRRLITTMIHVAEPVYLPFTVRLTVSLSPDTIALDQTAILGEIENALQIFFDPLVGGEDGAGWPFGRNVYLSEIYNLLDRQRGVDYVAPTVDPLNTSRTQPELSVVNQEDAGRLILNSLGELVGIEIRAEELLDARLEITLPPSE